MKLAIVVVVIIVITFLLSIIPYNVPQGVGSSSASYGIPFEFYSYNTPSYPNATTTTQFHAEALIANIVIVTVVTSLVVYLIGLMKTRRKS